MAHSIIKHNNKEILYIDHRGLSGDELYDSLKSVNEFLQKEKKKWLVIADFTDVTASQKANEYLGSAETKDVAKYIPTQAVVGISGIKKMVLRIYNVFTGLNLKVLDTLEEAKDYISTQSL